MHLLRKLQDRGQCRLQGILRPRLFRQAVAEPGQDREHVRPQSLDLVGRDLGEATHDVGWDSVHGNGDVLPSVDVPRPQLGLQRAEEHRDASGQDGINHALARGRVALGLQAKRRIQAPEDRRLGVRLVPKTFQTQECAIRALVALKLQLRSLVHGSAVAMHAPHGGNEILPSAGDSGGCTKCVQLGLLEPAGEAGIRDGVEIRGLRRDAKVVHHLPIIQECLPGRRDGVLQSHLRGRRQQLMVRMRMAGLRFEGRASKMRPCRTRTHPDMALGILSRQVWQMLHQCFGGVTTLLIPWIPSVLLDDGDEKQVGLARVVRAPRMPLQGEQQDLAQLKLLHVPHHERHGAGGQGDVEVRPKHAHILLLTACGHSFASRVVPEHHLFSVEGHLRRQVVHVDFRQPLRAPLLGWARGERRRCRLLRGGHGSRDDLHPAAKAFARVPTLELVAADTGRLLSPHGSLDVGAGNDGGQRHEKGTQR
mmetsp:Transcript_48901/g.157980  ORF Transcript_48901/g.157980 Transcript_48901/m.157980 type:complete len:479 (-) Transcript_48901:75-1511(-)